MRIDIAVSQGRSITDACVEQSRNRNRDRMGWNKTHTTQRHDTPQNPAGKHTKMWKIIAVLHDFSFLTEGDRTAGEFYTFHNRISPAGRRAWSRATGFALLQSRLLSHRD